LTNPNTDFLVIAVHLQLIFDEKLFCDTCIAKIKYKYVFNN
jgi:hypothetical protein